MMILEPKGHSPKIYILRNKLFIQSMQQSKIYKLAWTESKAPSLGFDVPSSENTFLHTLGRPTTFRLQHNLHHYI